MGKLLKEGTIFRLLGDIKSASTLAILAIVIAALAIIAKLTNLNIGGVLQRILRGVINASAKLIGRSERNYHRDLEIGKINEKMGRVKLYRFLNELTIDLGLKEMGCTPYELLFLSLAGTFVVTLVVCRALFGNFWMAIIMFPIAFVGYMSVLYTKANIAHDARIEDVIEAENIISNNIKNGVVVAVRESLNVIPVSVRGVFKDFLDNIEHKNYHIKTALLELNQQLGTVSDDFIKKCIVFETEEEHGIVGMFKDVVEMNNIKMELRTEMKRQFEEVVNEFIIGASMIFLFLGGVLAIYKNVAHFYLRTPLGQIIIAIDILIIISEFVYITYLRATEI